MEQKAIIWFFVKQECFFGDHHAELLRYLFKSRPNN